MILDFLINEMSNLNLERVSALSTSVGGIGKIARGVSEFRLYDWAGDVGEGQAEDALRAGQLGAGRIGERAGKTASRQAAAIGAQGGGFGGSPLLVMLSDLHRAARDQAAVAERAGVQAQAYRLSAEQRRRMARSALLTGIFGGLEAIGTGLYSYGKLRPGPNAYTQTMFGEPR